MIKAQDLRRGNPTGANQYAPAKEEKVFEKPIPLAEAGIDKNLANRARKAAELDEHEFEEKILDVRQGRPKKKRKPNTPRDPDFTDGKQLAVARHEGDDERCGLTRAIGKVLVDASFV
jgi:hypothetical protein